MIINMNSHPTEFPQKFFPRAAVFRHASTAPSYLSGIKRHYYIPRNNSSVLGNSLTSLVVYFYVNIKLAENTKPSITGIKYAKTT